MEKYTIPPNTKIRDTQKGKKSIENRSTKEAKILSAIFLYYLEASFEARPV